MGFVKMWRTPSCFENECGAGDYILLDYYTTHSRCLLYLLVKLKDAGKFGFLETIGVGVFCLFLGTFAFWCHSGHACRLKLESKDDARHRQDHGP